MTRKIKGEKPVRRGSRVSPRPAAALKSLDRLVGTWRLSGDVTGRVRYEWAQGGNFLIEHVDMRSPSKYGGRRVKGIWLIGQERRIGKKPSREIKSRFYDYLDGLTLDYVYELVGDTITIWFGDKGSDNLFKGRFAADGNSYSGEWRWPGGGYRATATRVR